MDTEKKPVHEAQDVDAADGVDTRPGATRIAEAAKTWGPWMRASIYAGLVLAIVWSSVDCKSSA
jgi:hypothetical protein